MEAKMLRDIRLLKIYALFTTLICGTLILTAFQSNAKKRFDEIDVERINVVEPNGKLDLTISNAVRFPPPVLNGKVMKRSGEVGRGTPGLVFFNGNGEEQGGLAWNSRVENGKFTAGAALMFDQYNQDQTVGITYDDSNGQRSAGLHVWDHPDIPLTEIWDRSEVIAKMKPGAERDAAMKKLSEDWGSQRVFIGKQPDRSAVLSLADTKGKARIRISVDATGAPRIEFLDEAGKTTYSLPPTKD